ncbi:Glu/Leu/Phe/Val family dehydrogenase [Arhodomonas aquaeolei]|uniref:Glu/Leu/Phe/Val family dehydrogenase n=1 Tax=Arhodomonas aquaeolei TaxID=2369 RepID=UPI0003826F37|nr:Glu/Leu/Phe/Val dehydrogenase [Arhodomonas aquaeolei]
MSVFEHREFREHERVVFGHDPDTGLRAIIAVHSTRLGPSLGGCRIFPYPDDDAALTDVLRLSRGMTYKSAMAGLPLGGGKAVVIADPHKDKTPALMRALGRLVEDLNGLYITAEDSGTDVDDLRTIAGVTGHVVGIADKRDADGIVRSGDPSPATARGIFGGIRASLRAALGRDDLDGVRVAVQGVGNVGHHLAAMLHNAGARLWVSDIDEPALRHAVTAYDAEPVDTAAIHAAPVDVFAPCAMGAVLNARTIPELQARVIAGSANNQLAEDTDGERLRERDILYAPDYVINAGGVIDVADEYAGYDALRVRRRVDAIADTLTEIYERAARQGLATSTVADHIAEERLAAARP